MFHPGWVCWKWCKPWWEELEARGFCPKTLQLCSTLAQGGNLAQLGQSALQELNASFLSPTERVVCLEANAFLQCSFSWRGSLRQWLQAASQEPDTSFLSGGAASTSQILGWPLVQWVGKPEGRYPGVFTFSGHSQSVNSVAFSLDGKRIVSGSSDNLVKIWDAETGHEVWTSRTHDFKDGCICKTGWWAASHGGAATDQAIVDNECPVTSHSGEINSVAFSPDGKRIVSGSADSLVKIWDAETGAGASIFVQLCGRKMRMVLTLGHNCKGSCICIRKKGDFNSRLVVRRECSVPGHSRGVTSVAFAPDGKYVVSGSLDARVKIWDAETGAEVWSTMTHDRENGCTCAWLSDNDCSVRGHLAPVNSVVFSPDGERVVSRSGEEEFVDNTVRIWDARTGAQIRCLGQHNGEGLCVCTGEKWRDGSFKRYNPQCPTIIDNHEDVVNSVAFSPDGRHIVSGSSDNLVKIWDAETGHEVHTLTGHSNYVSSVAFSPDGKHVVSGSHDNFVKIWDAETGAELYTLPGHSCEVNSVSFSSDGKRLISGSFDTLAKIWDAAIGAEVCTPMGSTSQVTRLQISDDGSQVISRSSYTRACGETVRFWDIASNTEVRQVAEPEFAFVDGEMMGDLRTNHHLITTPPPPDNDTLLITDLRLPNSAAPVACFTAPHPIWSVLCHGATICVGCEGGVVCILRAPFLVV